MLDDSTTRSTVAVVTGAARGIGRGIAVVLGQTGATVYVTDRETRGRRRTRSRVRLTDVDDQHADAAIPAMDEQAAQPLTANRVPGSPVGCVGLTSRVCMMMSNHSASDPPVM